MSNLGLSFAQKTSCLLLFGKLHSKPGYFLYTPLKPFIEYFGISKGEKSIMNNNLDILVDECFGIIVKNGLQKRQN